MKKLLKTTVLVAAAFAFGTAVVACDDTDGPGGTQEPTKYTVSYAIGEGATGTAPAGFQKAKDEKFNLAAYDAATATFSKEGYTFDGWHDGTAKYAAGYEYTMPDKAVTFTAQWKLEGEEGEYTITYVLNGGTGTAPTETNKNEGDTFTIAAAIVRENYNFAGWSDGTTTYAAGATYTVGTSNVVLTAQWTPKPGIQLPDEDILEYEGDCTLPLIKGYLSDKGMGDKGGENIVGVSFDTVNKDLYYKIKGSSGWVKSKTKYFDGNRNYMPDKYGETAPYYEIKIGELNYYALVKPDFSELTLCDTDDNILTGGVFTKVNQEAPLNVTVTFDLGYSAYGVTNPPDQTFANGGTATEPTEPARSGYTFDGWHVGTASGALFDFTTPVTNDITLVAAWTSNGAQYTISFTAAAGVTGTAPAPITVTQGDKYTLPANPYTKEGWTFAGWKNGMIFGQPGAQYTAGSTSATFTAVFQKTYNGDYGEVILRDDGKAQATGEWYDYEVLGDGFISISYGEYGEDVCLLDDENNTIAYADGLQNITKIAQNDAVLSFDGFGGATLDGHTGTYEIGGSYSNPTLTLTFGDVVVEDIPVVLGWVSVEDITLSATITIDGTDYVFESIIEIPDVFVGTFEGSKDGTDYVVVITADDITVTIGDADPVTAEITAYSDYEGFTVNIGEDEWYIQNTSYDNSSVDSIRLMPAENMSDNFTLNRKTETPGEAISTYVATYGYESKDAEGVQTVKFGSYDVYKITLTWNSSWNAYRVQFFYNAVSTTQTAQTFVSEGNYENLNNESAANQAIYAGSASNRVKLEFSTVDGVKQVTITQTVNEGAPVTFTLLA